MSRDKGARIERELVAAHEAIGIKAARVPLSGQTGWRNVKSDLDIYAFGPEAAPLVAEVKARGSGTGFVQLERWLDDADLLVLRRDRADPMVLLPWSTWVRLLRR